MVVTVLLEDLLLSDTEPDTRSRVGQTTPAGNEPSQSDAKIEVWFDNQREGP